MADPMNKVGWPGGRALTARSLAAPRFDPGRHKPPRRKNGQDGSRPHLPCPSHARRSLHPGPCPIPGRRDRPGGAGRCHGSGQGPDRCYGGCIADQGL